MPKIAIIWEVIAVPGNMLGVGLSVAPASGAYDIMMAWEETPYLQ